MLRRIMELFEGEEGSELESDRIADEWYEAKYSGASAEELAAIDARHAAATAAERELRQQPQGLRGRLRGRG